MRQFIAQAWDRLTHLLYKRTILVLALLFCIGVAISVWNMSRLSSTLMKEQAVWNIKVYAQILKEARTFYNTEAVKRVQFIPGVSVTHDYHLKRGAIPLPATYLIQLGSEISQKNQGMSIRLYSDYPFPWRQAEGGPKDSFETAALRYLKQNPNGDFYRFEKFKGRPSLRYAEADILQPSCIDCHNHHPDSPKRDWQVGDVRGILEITSPLNMFVEKTRSGLRGTVLVLGGISILAVFGITLVIGRLRETSRELEYRVIERTSQLQQANLDLAKEQEKSESLLANILPEPIAQQLKQGHHNIADGFAEVTILFADIVGFTELSSGISPEELVKLLNRIFSAFDRLSEKHGVEKIKTIGDAYMVAAGLPYPRSDHAEAIAEMALDMQQEIEHFNELYEVRLKMRIGINTGPVVAGVIGTKKFIYDLWGDAVNIAARMESHGKEGCIQVSSESYQLLRDRYFLELRGSISVKGKGEMVTYLLKGRRTEDIAKAMKPSCLS